jgi:acyl dehydratase
MAAEKSYVTRELRDLLGKETPPMVLEVEKGNIRRWAEAVGDFNPLWTDEEYARKSRYGHIIAPPTFLVDRGIVPLGDKIIALGKTTNFINGGTEIEYFKPVEIGDALTSTARLIDIKEKTGSSGTLVILLLEMVYKNQRNEIVRKVTNTFIQIHPGEEQK